MEAQCLYRYKIQCINCMEAGFNEPLQNLKSKVCLLISIIYFTLTYLLQMIININSADSHNSSYQVGSYPQSSF